MPVDNSPERPDSKQAVPFDWRDWIDVAQKVVDDWETGSSRRLLSSRESAALIERIARALHDAYSSALPK